MSHAVLDNDLWAVLVREDTQIVIVFSDFVVEVALESLVRRSLLE